MASWRDNLLRGILAASVLAAVSTGLWPHDYLNPPALAADGCADIDGDGVVHIADFVRWASALPQPSPGIPERPPPPPQLDIVKDGELNLLDLQALFGRFDQNTSCQADPLPKTALADGALAVDANGENAKAGDPVEKERAVLVGSSFRVAVQLTASPEIAAYQVRLHWDESLLDLNARTASDNDMWQENVDFAATPLQVLGPVDDDTGSESHIELGALPFMAPRHLAPFSAPLLSSSSSVRQRALQSLPSPATIPSWLTFLRPSTRLL